MKKSVQNYILIFFGFTIIVLLIFFHLIDCINDLMHNYNWIVRTTNNLYNTTYSEKEVYFFGDSYNSFIFLLDTIMVIIIVLVVVMVFLAIYWSEIER